MKTLQEKYNAILEGKFSKAQFVRDARMELPNLITQFNGFEDTTIILKNRGMIFEAKKVEVKEYDKPAPGYSIETLERAVDYEIEGMGLQSQETVSEEDYAKAKAKAEKNLDKNPNHYLQLLSGDSKKVDKHDKYVEVKKNNHVDTFNGMKKAELKESIIERAINKGYTREQVETALTRLKEKKGKDHDGDGDIDSDDYMIAKGKAIKKGIGKNVNEGRRKKTQGGKIVTENDYETGGYIESMGPMFDKAVGGLVAAFIDWKEGPMTEPGMIPHAKKDVVAYIDNQLEQSLTEDQEGVNEQYFDELEAAKDYARKESEQGFVQHVNKHPKGGYKVEDWLDGSDTVASYEGGDVLEEDHTGNPNDKYLKSIKRIIQFPDVQEDPDPHFSMGRGELVWNYLTQTFPELNRIGEEEWMQINSLVYQELKKQGLDEDYKPSLRAYNVIDGEGNIVYKELPRDTAIEKAGEREDYKFSATDRLAEGEEYLQENKLAQKQIKEAIKGIITNILKEEVITEAATGNLSKIADTYNDFEGMQSAVNALENIVTDVESYYAKTKEKIQKVYDSFNNIKNPEGISMGALIGPAIESAFKKDLRPVASKGFTEGLKLPKVRMIQPGDIQEDELEEKATVFTPISENRKRKYTKR